VRLLTDGTGTEVGTQQYDAFGAPRSQTGVQLSLGFTGEQRDGESGLIYLRARYYDPKTGRFLTTDPLRGSAWRPASQHAYVYALNNPLRYRDPRGREAGDGGCCDPAFGDAVGGSAPAHEPVLFGAAIEPLEGGADGPACEPGVGDGDCTTTVQEEGCLLEATLCECNCGPGFGQGGPAGFGAPGRVVPGRPFTGPNAPQQAAAHLARFHGIPENVALNRIHRIKEAASLRPTDDVIIGRTGDVYSARDGAWLGSATDPSWGH
jgi:RHS repeat-associated protein